MESLPHTYPSHLTYPSHNHGYSLLHKTRAVEIWFLYCVNLFVYICFWTTEFLYTLCAYQLRVGKQVCIWMSANFRSITHKTRSNLLLTHAVVLRARVYSVSLACHTRLKHNSSIKLRVRIAGKRVILICNAPEGYTHSSLSDTYISPHLRWQYVMSFFTTSNFSCIKMHVFTASTLCITTTGSTTVWDGRKKNNCCQHVFVFAMDSKTKKSSKSKMGKNKLLQTLRNIIHCDTRVHFKFPKHLIRYATGN